MTKLVILVLVIIAFALIHFQRRVTDVWASRLVGLALALVALFALVEFLSKF